MIEDRFRSLLSALSQEDFGKAGEIASEIRQRLDSGDPAPFSLAWPGFDWLMWVVERHAERVAEQPREVVS